jgi:uncharacterized protein YcbX
MLQIHFYFRIKVSKLFYYPIKSCKGIEVTSAVTSKTGFKYDRSFMLVDKNLKFISQRTFPQLALVEIDLLENKGLKNSIK